MIGFTNNAASAQPGRKTDRVPMGFTGTTERREMVVTSECPADESSPTTWLLSSMEDYTRV